ncbi:MAG TPA: AMP-binding protein [Saprospiraceae bacterium]|nr:AMP-binding protein [Saprospiraceae bacterium]
MNDHQFDSHEDLVTFKQERLRMALNYCFEHSPFYRERFDDLGLNFNSNHWWNNFKKIPFTTKDDLSRMNAKFIATDPTHFAEFVTTSGTLGAPVPLVLSDHDLDRLAYNEACGLSIAGLQTDDIVQITTTLDRRFMAGLAYYLGVRKIGAATIRVGIGLPALQWESIHQFHPTVLIGVPSFIVKLILFARQNNIDLNSASIKKIICIGEPIRYKNFELNRTGQFITDNWKVQLYSTYASTEMATAFSECDQGCGGHELPDLIYTEVVNESGDEVPDGEPGELVFTTLGIEGMPLVRYRSGDIMAKFSAPCGCGRTTSRLGAVLGRLGQMLKFKGTTVFPSSFQHLLDQRPEIESYVIEASSNYYGEDEIKIFISTSADEKEVSAELTELFKAHLRVTPGIEFRPAAFIHHLRNVPELRKPRIFIDNRPHL